MTDLKIKHDLPRDVLYCRKCVMSNQRPASSPEFKKRSTSDTPTSSFGDDGVCDACRYQEYKKTIDWPSREKCLQELCDKFRRDDGRYDVIVPGSGGKDSIFVSHFLKTKFGMNPLCVTWSPHAYTDIGRHNLEAWQKTGVDHTSFTPNPKTHSYLTRLAFLNLVNPFQPFILGQKILAPRMALLYDVPLIMYGENQAECHNSFYETISPLMDTKHFTSKGPEEELFFGGVEKKELISEHGISIKDLQPYLPLPAEEVERSKIEVHYMSYYVNWSPQQNYYYVSEFSDFESTQMDGVKEHIPNIRA